MISESIKSIKEIKYEIKEKFFSLIFISPNKQILSFEENILEDNKTLSYYNIKNKSTILLKINMNIFIELDNEKILILEVKPFETVKNIKNKIKNQEDIALEQQNNLVYTYLPLEDEKTLSDYKIQNFSILRLKVKEENSVYIIIYGEKKKLFIPNFKILVYDLKFYVREISGIPKDQLRFSYEGKILSENKTLLDYNIHKESILHLSLVLR